jgi:anti-sigma B factor antagonist
MAQQPPEPFSLDVREDGDRLVIRPAGELDLATAPELEGVLLPAVREGRSVVLDLRGLEFLDSSGVRTIVEAHGQATEAGGRFGVVRPGEGSDVWRILEVSGVDRVLQVVDL